MALTRMDPGRSVQLLVEGKDAEQVLTALAGRLSLPQVQVHDFGGVDQLRTFLAAFIAAPDFRHIRSLGLVLNAGESSDAAFQNVCGALAPAGLNAPPHPAEPSGENPSLGVFILPGNGRPGTLETLLCETLTNDPVALCIDAFLGCAVKRMGTPLQRPEKARAHAWIATRPEPGVSVGAAAQKGYWNLDHKALEPLRQFLTALSGNTPPAPAADAPPDVAGESAD